MHKFQFSWSTYTHLPEWIISLWNQGKVVVSDSNFFVLNGACWIEEEGCICSNTNKKQQYWPNQIKGDDIIQHFAELNVGDVNAMDESMTGVTLHMTAMKEPNYAMQLVTTYSALNTWLL